MRISFVLFLLCIGALCIIFNCVEENIHSSYMFIIGIFITGLIFIIAGISYLVFKVFPEPSTMSSFLNNNNKKEIK